MAAVTEKFRLVELEHKLKLATGWYTQSKKPAAELISVRSVIGDRLEEKPPSYDPKSVKCEKPSRIKR